MQPFARDLAGTPTIASGSIPGFVEVSRLGVEHFGARVAFEQDFAGLTVDHAAPPLPVDRKPKADGSVSD